MTDALLSPEEMAAIQKATSPAKKPPVISPPSEELEVGPVALIADDREGERARPRALAIANRLAAVVASRFRRAFNLELEVQVEGADVADGNYVIRELPNTWARAVQVEGGSQTLVVSVGGHLVEVVAAILLGAKIDDDDDTPTADRNPSPVARKIFTRGGRMVVAALLDIWRDEDHRPIEPVDDAAQSEQLWRALSDTDPLIVATLKIQGPVAGTIRLIGTPEAFIVPRPAPAPTKVPREVVAQVLGGVGVELVVELGGARLPMRQVKNLAPGTLIKLDRSMSEPVPIRCEGVIKAKGQVISQNGNFAVEIVKLINGLTEEN